MLKKHKFSLNFQWYRPPRHRPALNPHPKGKAYYTNSTEQENLAIRKCAAQNRWRFFKKRRHETKYHRMVKKTTLGNLPHTTQTFAMRLASESENAHCKARAPHHDKGAAIRILHDRQSICLLKETKENLRKCQPKESETLTKLRNLSEENWGTGEKRALDRRKLTTQTEKGQFLIQ